MSTRRMALVAFLITSTTSTWPAVCLGTGQPTTVSCLTGKCHREIGASRYVHGPIGSGSCEICHQVSHWQEGKHPSLLTSASAEKCFFCHEESKSFTRMKYQHTPMAKGECVSCHDPHDSDNPFMLSGKGKGPIAKTAETCTPCHDGVNSLKSSEFHSAVALLDCSICHDPHASANPYQLTRYVKTVYLRDHLALAKDDIKSGDYRNALVNLKLVLTVEPRELSALTMAVESYLALNELEPAVPLVDRLIEANRLNAEAYYLKGRLVLAQGKDFQAMSLIQQALSLKPDDPFSLLELGRLQARKGMHIDALASLSKAAKNAPSDLEIHRSLAETYQALGQSNEAEKEQAIIRKLMGEPKPAAP